MSPTTPPPGGQADGEVVLFSESGTNPWLLGFGPAFAAVGIVVENLAPGGASVLLWLGAGLVVFLYTLLLMRARSRHLCVELTTRRLRQGSQSLPVSHISSVRPDDGEPPVGRVLGDGPVVPRRYGPVGLRLTDGARVVAWAHDGAGLRRELETLIRARSTPTRKEPG